VEKTGLRRFKPVKTRTSLKTGPDQKYWSKVVQSSLLMVWDIYRPVSVSVFPKIDKRPDWTGLLNTNSDVPAWPGSHRPSMAWPGLGQAKSGHVL